VSLVFCTFLRLNPPELDLPDAPSTTPNSYLMASLTVPLSFSLNLLLSASHSSVSDEVQEPGLFFSSPSPLVRFLGLLPLLLADFLGLLVLLRLPDFFGYFPGLLAFRMDSFLAFPGEAEEAELGSYAYPLDSRFDFSFSALAF